MNWKNIATILWQGILDDNKATSLLSEIKAEIGILEGSHAKVINNVLKQQGGISKRGFPNFRLGAYYETLLADNWVIKKEGSASAKEVVTLVDEIEEALTKRKCFRRVTITTKPLTLSLAKKVAIQYLDDYVNLLDKYSSCFTPAYSTFNNKELLTVFNLNSEKFAHSLVCGITGSGKTQLLKAIIYSLAITNKPEELSMVMVDPKGLDFSSINIPHLASKPIIDLALASNAIHQVRLELDRRMAKSDRTKKAIVIVCDEVANFAEDKNTISDLVHIARLGRALHIHLILATQRPTSKSLDTTLRSQLTCNLTGVVSSPEEAKYASGIANSGAERLEGKGQFLLNAPGYNNLKIQGLLIRDEKSLPVLEGISHFKVEEKELSKDEVKKEIKLPNKLPNKLPRFLKDKDKLVSGLKSLSNIDTTIVRNVHKELYSKELNYNTAIKIVEWVTNNG